MQKSIPPVLALLAITSSMSAATVAKRSQQKTAHPVAVSSKRRGIPAPSVKGQATKGRRTRYVAHPHQVTPTPDRYREIQTALVSKGYLKSEPNGEWGADSVDALKRFQADQNLTADGKLSSLSLIAMGLGPKRLTAQAGAPAQAPSGEVQK